MISAELGVEIELCLSRSLQSAQGLEGGGLVRQGRRGFCYVYTQVWLGFWISRSREGFPGPKQRTCSKSSAGECQVLGYTG